MAPEELHGNDLSSEGQDIEKVLLIIYLKILFHWVCLYVAAQTL